MRGLEQVLEVPTGVKIEKVSNEAVELRIGGEAVSLDAEGLDRVLRRVAHIRADMRPEVPAGLENTTMIAQVDPAWRTFPSLHPGTPGVALNLRHAGYGWLGFVLPDEEALKLGRWLVGHIEEKQRAAAKAAPEGPSGEAK